MTDDQLLEGIWDNDPAAFDIVYDRLYKQLCYFAKDLIKDSSDAKDIVTEAFVKLWEKKKKFESFLHVESYLYNIIRNACINYLNKNKYRTKIEKRLAKTIALSENLIEKKYFEAQLVRMLYARIETLPEKQKMVFKLSYLEGHTRNEVSQLLGISENTVRNINQQALKSLRSTFGSGKPALFISLAILNLLSSH